MHYRQTIVDAALTTLSALGEATDRDFFAADTYPRVQVWISEELLPAERRSMAATQQNREATLTIVVTHKSNDVQRAMNEVLEGIEGAMADGLDDVVQCATLERVAFEIEAGQDQESGRAQLDYAVDYATVMGDPSQRV